MKIDRRHLALPTLVLGVLGAIPALAESADEATVAKSVEAFRVAQIARDGNTLEKLCAPQLSYGHSAGKIETKAEFIAGSMKTKYNALTHNDTAVHTVGDTSIVRFKTIGETESEGKKNPINIGVLMVWQKQGGDWKLLARQSVKL